MTSVKSQVTDLSQKAASFAASMGADSVLAFQQSSFPVLSWVQCLSTSHRTQTANELLDAMLPTLREAAGCIALGLSRPALALMRSQVDILLAWLFYKDHPVEWRHVNETGENFRLKKQLLEYLSDYNQGFGLRFGILKERRTRTLEDPYRLISAHVHGQSTAVLPSLQKLSDGIATSQIIEECVEIEAQIAEYLSDILVAIFGADWAAMPESISASLPGRFKTPSQQTQFFESFGGG